MPWSGGVCVCTCVSQCAHVSVYVLWRVRVSEEYVSDHGSNVFTYM